jgi:hypothetical protein
MLTSRNPGMVLSVNHAIFPSNYIILFLLVVFTFAFIIPVVWIKNLKKVKMNNLFRGLLSGYGAWKLGGGCFGTVVIFIIIWVFLGQCS